MLRCVIGFLKSSFVNLHEKGDFVVVGKLENR